MREFINKHPRWYWFIVVSVAVLAFTIVTFIGCAKLERAEAAEQTLKVNWKGKEVYFPLGNYPYYCIVKDGVESGSDAVYLSFDKLTVTRPTAGSAYYGFGVYDSTGNVDMTKNMVRFYGYDYNETDFSESYNDWYGYTFGTSLPSATRVISNYDICYCDTGEVVFSANPYGPKKIYSLDAPYISFQKVVVDNKLHDYYYNPRIFDSFYETYIKPSTWTYFGKLNNIDSALDKGYLLEATFLVELPTLEYIMGQYEAYDIDITWETNVIKKSGDMFHEWANNKKAPCVELEFEYAFPIEPDANGNFTYSMTFEEIEFLLRVFNSEFQSQMVNYNDYTRSLIMSYLHIECVTASVQTSRDNTLLYGKVCTNQFERGIYDVCVEVIPEIDINTATPEEMDKILSDAVEEAHDKYIQDLENRVEQLETEMNNATGSLGSFDSEFSGNGLWGAVKGLGNGLLGMTGFLASVAGVFGSVFSFFPYDVQQIVGYFLIISLLVALWKLIKG